MQKDPWCDRRLHVRRSPRALNEVAAQPEEAPDDGVTSAASDSDADDVEANALPEAEARDVHVQQRPEQAGAPQIVVQ